MIDLSRLTPAPWHVERLTVHASFRQREEPEVKVGDSKYDGDPGNFLHRICDLSCTRGKYEIELTNAEFIALARNAFDVMMRRGWYAYPVSVETWQVEMCGISNDDRRQWMALGEHADPFTALVEADKWYKENVEKSDVS